MEDNPNPSGQNTDSSNQASNPPETTQNFGTMAQSGINASAYAQPVPAATATPSSALESVKSPYKKPLIRYGIIVGVVLVVVIVIVVLVQLFINKSITCRIPGISGEVTFTYNANTLTGYSMTGEFEEYNTYTSSDFENDQEVVRYRGLDEALDSLEDEFKSLGGYCKR